MPIELVTKMSFIEYYIEFLKAYENRLNCKIPLAIMTSDDTHELTQQLLQENGNFGLELITIVRQEKVPALIDVNGRFSLEHGKFLIETKPHGHGDVHTKLHSSGVARKWLHELNKKWVIFFQDTNPLVFRSFPAVLGVNLIEDEKKKKS